MRRASDSVNSDGMSVLSVPINRQISLWQILVVVGTACILGVSNIWSTRDAVLRLVDAVQLLRIDLKDTNARVSMLSGEVKEISGKLSQNDNRLTQQDSRITDISRRLTIIEAVRTGERNR